MQTPEYWSEKIYYECHSPVMGHASVKPAFVAQIQADARAELIAAITALEDLSRNMNTTRQTLRDRLGALLRSNDQGQTRSAANTQK